MDAALDRPASYREIMRLFSEGRAQVEGVARVQVLTSHAQSQNLGRQGITEFVRYGFMRRSGLAYLSVPLGQIRVAERLPHTCLETLIRGLIP